jgi:hypothetical protein
MKQRYDSMAAQPAPGPSGPLFGPQAAVDFAGEKLPPAEWKGAAGATPMPDYMTPGTYVRDDWTSDKGGRGQSVEPKFTRNIYHTETTPGRYVRGGGYIPPRTVEREGPAPVQVPSSGPRSRGQSRTPQVPADFGQQKKRWELTPLPWEKPTPPVPDFPKNDPAEFPLTNPESVESMARRPLPSESAPPPMLGLEVSKPAPGLRAGPGQNAPGGSPTLMTEEERRKKLGLNQTLSTGGLMWDYAR